MMIFPKQEKKTKSKSSEPPSAGDKRKSSLRPEQVLQEFQENMTRALKDRDKQWHKKIAEWKKSNEKQKKRSQAILKERDALKEKLEAAEKENQDLKTETFTMKNENTELHREIQRLRNQN